MTPKSLLPLLAALSIPASVSAAIQTDYVDISSFRDFSLSGGNESRAQRAFDAELKRQSRLNRLIGVGRTLKLTFLDIDMAGAIEPWRFRSASHVRIIKDVYPPRLRFTYELRSASGNILASGEETLRDVSFQRYASVGRTASPFYYEMKLLEKWARKKFPSS
ncbi:MAG: DUF3016 domain-containing protein [Verrucomicrobiota bacterium]